MKYAKIAGLATAVILATLIFLNQIDQPFLWIYLLWLGTCIFGVISATSSNSKAALVNLAVVCATLLGVEIYATRMEGSRPAIDRNYGSGYRTSDPILGYRPNKGVRIQSDLYADDSLVYDVTYTIDTSGVRASPPVESARCILFFGGSFTFGEGVEDHETLPWRVGENLDIRTFNYGFHGYGPHHMLALIEDERIPQASDCESIDAVYLLIDSHIYRSSGKVSWDKDGPQYQLDSNGHASYQGAFSTTKGSTTRVVEKIESKLARSAAYRYFFRDRHRQANEDGDVELLAGIIATARLRLQEEYPLGQFLVLHWDNQDSPLSAKLQDQLRRRAISVYELSEQIPDFRENQDEYTLLEGHPTALAYSEIASALGSLLNPVKSAPNHPDE